LSGHGEKKSRKLEDAIGALLAYPTITEAANSLGLSEKTLRRWLRDPGFCARYRAARRQAMEQSIAAMQQASSHAVDALVRNLNCGVPTAEISAARALLEHALDAGEVVDLAERIDALEARAAEQARAAGVRTT
jgi:hypothetical protein